MERFNIFSKFHLVFLFLCATLRALKFGVVCLQFAENAVGVHGLSWATTLLAFGFLIC